MSAVAADLAQRIELAGANMANRWWRLNNLYWITNEKGQAIQFKANEVQRAFYFSMWWFNVILKSRQHGFSTFIQLLILDACLFNENLRAGVIAHTKEDAQVIFRDKIKFAYDHLPGWLKDQKRATSDSARELIFNNGSSVRVGTSMRSGTLQYLHVSELGKIGRKYPEKDEEIRAGAMNTVHEDGFIFFESTAEGRAGLFYETVMQAEVIEAMGRAPNRMEFKLHFFPWWRDARCRVDPEGVVLLADELRYFDELHRVNGISLDAEQKAWYALKARTQGERMLQEYPSTRKEAFEITLKGSIYGAEIARARIERRITRLPFDPTYPVNTFWDLGRNDKNCIWFHQRVGAQNRFIDYYENRFESIDHYARILTNKSLERGYVYKRHYLPHDAEVVDLTRADHKSRREVLESLGIRPTDTVPRIDDIREGINMVREAFSSCWFDESACDPGIKGLESYQREWDDKMQEFKDRPKHDWASNPADAFRQFAQGYRAPSMAPKQDKPRASRRNWRVA
jgi:hypothetical protein